MPIYRLRLQREVLFTVDAQDTEAAGEAAKNLVRRDPALKLLDVVRTDLLETTSPPTDPQGQAA